MISRRVFMPLTATILTICLIMLGATFLAHASSLRSGSSWAAPQNVSDPINPDIDLVEVGPNIGVDSDGTINIVWAKGADEYSPDPCYVYSADGGHTWSSPVIQNTDHGSYETAIVMGDDKIHVTWFDKTGAGSALRFWLYYSYISGGSWHPQPPIVAETEDIIANPVIALGKDSLDQAYIYLLWSQAPSGAGLDLHYSRRPLGGGPWTPNPPAVVSDTVTFSMYPSMAADIHGNLHVVWQEDLPGGDIYYTYGAIDGGGTTWSPPINMSGVVTQATTPDIVVGGDDVVHVVFGQRIDRWEQYVWYVNFSIGEDPSLATPVKVTDSRVGISYMPPYYTQPSVSLNGTDEVHILWNGQMSGDLADVIYHVVSEDQGTSWSTPRAVSLDQGVPDRYPALVIEPGGVVRTVWQQYDLNANDKDIYYSCAIYSGIPPMYLPLVFKSYP